MIKKSDFTIRNKQGELVVKGELLKTAIIKEDRIKSDGRNLYYLESGNILKKFSNPNLEIRQLLFNIDAQRIVSQLRMQRIIDDLIIDPELQINTEILNSPQYINLKNGIYDLQSKSLLDKSRCADWKFTYMIDAEFNITGTEVPIRSFNKFIQNSFQEDSNKIRYFLENIGFLLSSVNGYRKAVVFLGKSGAGKSMIANLISSLITPASQVSHVNFQDLSARFSTFAVASAKLNFGDEMTSRKINNLAKFKSITAGEPIMVEQKGKDPIKIYPNVRQIYTANDLPEFDDGDKEAVLDRLNIVLFSNAIPIEDRESKFIDKLLKEKSIIVTQALEAFADVYNKDGIFSEPEEVKRFKRNLLKLDDSVSEFIEENVFYDEESKGIGSQKLYGYYYKFCIDMDLEIKSKRQFTSILIQKMPNIEKKRVRISECENVMAYTHLRYKG